MGRNPPPPTIHHPGTFKALPGNLGSLFLVYNLILTQVDEICKKMGYHKKNYLTQLDAHGVEKGT
jgi:hypothetical protein